MREQADGIFIPRTVVWGVIISVPTLLIGASWYMAVQASEARTLTRDFLAFQVETIKQRADDQEKVRAANQAVAAIDLRLTRMEAQLSFLVSTQPPLLLGPSVRK